MGIKFSSELLHDSTLFKIDFSEWPSSVSLYFWASGEIYKLRLFAVLSFRYEVSNIGEFALPCIDSYHVEIREISETEDWVRRIQKRGAVSEKYDRVFQLGIASNMLRTKGSEEDPFGMSIFFRDYGFVKVEDGSIAPGWLQKYGGL